MCRAIVGVLDSVFGKARLPDLSHEAQFLLGAKRESSLDELHRALQWNFERGCKDGVNVGHDDEFMDLETAALAIVGEHVDQKRGHAVSLEQAATSPGIGGHEEGTDRLWGGTRHHRR